MQALVPEGGRGLARFHACVGWLTFWPGMPLHYAGDEQAFRSFGTASRSKRAALMVRHGLAAISSPDCDGRIEAALVCTRDWMPGVSDPTERRWPWSQPAWTFSDFAARPTVMQAPPSTAGRARS